MNFSASVLREIPLFLGRTGAALLAGGFLLWSAAKTKPSAEVLRAHSALQKVLRAGVAATCSG